MCLFEEWVNMKPQVLEPSKTCIRFYQGKTLIYNL